MRALRRRRAPVAAWIPPLMAFALGGCGSGYLAISIGDASVQPDAISLTVQPEPLLRVRLRWSAVDAVPRYTVVRNGSIIAEIRSTEFTDRGLEQGVEYCYQVFASAPAGLDARSATACVRAAL